jgi:YVTN family beta-propeller protein
MQKWIWGSMTGVRAAAVLLLLFICMSCGQTYRPVATPITPNPPNPGFAHLALVISGNGSNNPGASTSINVSGDTAVSRSIVGLMPVHAFMTANGAGVFVANSGDGTVSVFSSSSPAPVGTIVLPSGAAQAVPVFVASTETDAVWVADAANNQVDELLTSNNAVAYQIGVGTSPVALAETPNTQKLYVANRGSGGSGGSVTSINPSDRSVNPPIAGGSWISPIAVAVRADSARAYVLDQGSAMVSAVDTSSDTVVKSISVGVGANFMVYDSRRNRLYVANPVANTVTFLDVSSDALSAVVVPVAHPVSVAALPDGSRAYVSSATVSGGRVTSQVTVINASDGSVKTIIPLTTAGQVCASNPSELQVAASADSTRVYVGNCDAGNVAVVSTLDDSVQLHIPAPEGASFGADGKPLPQTPVFVVAGP